MTFFLKGGYNKILRNKASLEPGLHLEGADVWEVVVLYLDLLDIPQKLQLPP